MVTEYLRSDRRVPLWLVMPFTLIAGFGAMALIRCLNRSWIRIGYRGVLTGVEHTESCWNDLTDTDLGENAVLRRWT